MEQLGAVEVRVTDEAEVAGRSSVEGLLRVKAEAQIIGSAVAKAVGDALRDAAQKPVGGGEAAGPGQSGGGGGGGNRFLMLGRLAGKTRLGGKIAGGASRLAGLASAAGLSGGMLMAAGAVGVLAASAGIAAAAMNRWSTEAMASLEHLAAINPTLAAVSAGMSVHALQMDLIRGSALSGSLSAMARAQIDYERTILPIQIALRDFKTRAATAFTRAKTAIAEPISAAVAALTNPAAEQQYRLAKRMTEEAMAAGDETAKQAAEAQMKIAAEMGSIRARVAIGDATRSLDSMNLMMLRDFEILSGGSLNAAEVQQRSRAAGPSTPPAYPDQLAGWMGGG